jgi:hypothetical protein
MHFILNYGLPSSGGAPEEEEHIDFFLANAIYMASSVASMLPRLPKFEFIQPALAALTGYSMPCQPVRACQPAAAAQLAN